MNPETKPATKQRVSLLCVCGTTQLLAALCAAKSRESLFPDKETQYVLVVADLFYSYHREYEFANAILELSKFWQWQHKIFIETKTATSLVRNLGSLKKKASNLKQLIGVERVDEVYLLRENFGPLSNLLMYAYSDAYKITYGDGYGLVYDPKFFKKINPWKPSLKRRIYTNIKTALIKKTKQEIPLLKFDEAVLTIPIDYSGAYLKNIKHSFVSLSLFKEIIKAASEFIKPEVLGYLQSKCDLDGSRIDMMLLTTSSGPIKEGTVEFEQKVSGYLELVKKHCPSGGKVIIKPHPRCSTVENVALSNRLSNNYEPILIDERISYYPIELIVLFLQVGLIVSFLSHSSLVIASLGNYSQIYEHDRSFFEKSIKKQELDYFLDAQTMISESVRSINNGWNGETVLWSREGN
ncbi:MAG: hypothetical protein F6J93_11485 [Oscillatoria sp. SIO1A7]|nr:hypothetical protein [Oscillatoria sp. SIO1A7]